MLHRRIRLAFRHMHALGEQLEVVDQLFHVRLHADPRRRRDLVIFDNHRTGVFLQPGHALLNDAVALAHFFHAHQITVVTVAGATDRNLEVHAVVDFIRLHLAQVPGNAGTTQHRTGKAERLGAIRIHHGNADGALFPDAVVGQQGFVFVDVAEETIREIFQEVEHAALAVFVHAADIRLVLALVRLVMRHAVRQIAIDAARTVIGRVHARAGYRLVNIHQIFALAEGVEEHRHRANVERVRTEPEQVIQDAGDLVEHHADVLRTFRHLNTDQLLDGHAVGMLVDHHRHVVETIHIRHGLQEGLGFRQFLGAAMQQADVRVGAFDDFAVEFQHQTQYAMSGGVLRAEVDRVVANFGHYAAPRWPTSPY